MLYLGVVIAAGFVGFVIGKNVGYDEGFAQGAHIGRVRQMINEGYSLQDISRILKKEMTQNEVNHF